MTPYQYHSIMAAIFLLLCSSANHPLPAMFGGIMCLVSAVQLIIALAREK